MRRLGPEALLPLTARQLFSWAFTRLFLSVLCFSYALPALHFAAVAHEVCAQHGVLEHVHAPSEAAGPEAAKGAAVSAAVSSDEHECCGVPGISQPSALATEGAVVACFRLELPPGNALREAPSNSSVALLSYAPKLAPPV